MVFPANLPITVPPPTPPLHQGIHLAATPVGVFCLHRMARAKVGAVVLGVVSRSKLVRRSSSKMLSALYTIRILSSDCPGCLRGAHPHTLPRSLPQRLPHIKFKPFRLRTALCDVSPPFLNFGCMLPVFPLGFLDLVCLGREFGEPCFQLGVAL